MIQGQQLDYVSNPDANGTGTTCGARVGHENVVEIVVSQLAGPMGYYDVAIVRRDNSDPDEIFPLHFMESIRLLAV